MVSLKKSAEEVEQIRAELLQFYEDSGEPIHLWFELSYANYLTIPRSVLEAMPSDWQVKMACLLEELDRTIDWRPEEGRYWVQLKDANGRYRSDPLSNYRHPEKGTIKFK